jgi:hypothetical protein
MKQKAENLLAHRHRWIQELASWIFVFGIVSLLILTLVISHAHANALGKMTLYFHKEASDINETYNAMSFTPPEPAADTAPGTLTSATNVNATPPTSFCEAGDGQTDVQNERAASAATTGNRCLGTFISQQIGNAISIATGDGATAIASQLWSSESATQAAVALNVYLYRCTTTCISTTTLTSGDRIATLTCAEPGITATSCTASSAPANNITFNTTDRIVAVVSSNVTVLRAGADTRFYFDSTGRTAASITLKYTALGYNTTNKPSLSGSLDDDFTTAAATTACTTGGVAYNTKWTCSQGSAANTAGAFNAEDAAGSGGGDSSSWLWLKNQTTTTAATTSNFGTTPSNTFLYQSMPSSYGDGNIRTAVNSTATFGVGATNPTSPFNHTGLVLWTSNTDYLELQVYSTGATTGTNSVVVALNNSGTLGTTTSLNASTTTGVFGEVWLGFSNTGGSWQAQYSTDGTTWNNVGSAVSHTTAFTRTGLNSFVKIANPVSTYAGAFEWFSYGLANPTYNQTSFEFFDNADSTTPGTAHGNNTNYTLTSSGQPFRLRQLLKINGAVFSTGYSSTLVDSSITNSSSLVPVYVNGNDNFPRLAYGDTSGNLKYIQCLDSLCTTKNTTTIATDGVTNGGGLAMKIGSDGDARIVYTQTGSHLKFIQCTNADCTTNSSTVLDSSSSIVDMDIAIASSDGFPRIVYGENPGTSQFLKYIQCTNASCSTNNVGTIESTIYGQHPSLAIGSDGFGRIIYNEGSSNAQFVQCTNASCSTSTSNSISSSQAGNLSLKLGSDGFGRAVVVDSAAGVSYIQCTNASCSTKNSTVITSDFANTLNGVSLALNNSDIGTFVLGDNVTSLTSVVACSNASCSSNSTQTIDTRTSIVGGVYIDSGGQLHSAYTDSTGLYLLGLGGYKLQYATQGSSCSTASYSDVSASTPIAFNDNPTPANGASISATGSDPTDTGQTVSPQTYVEANNMAQNSSIGNSVDGEWDISLIDNSAPAGTAYCMRLVQSDGTAFTTYTNYPVITTFSSAGPTTDQILRGGKWFSGGSKQPFFWAN